MINFKFRWTNVCACARACQFNQVALQWIVETTESDTHTQAQHFISFILLIRIVIVDSVLVIEKRLEKLINMFTFRWLGDGRANMPLQSIIQIVISHSRCVLFKCVVEVALTAFILSFRIDLISFMWRFWRPTTEENLLLSSLRIEYAQRIDDDIDIWSECARAIHRPVNTKRQLIECVRRQNHASQIISYQIDRHIGPPKIGRTPTIWYAVSWINDFNACIKCSKIFISLIR